MPSVKLWLLTATGNFEEGGGGEKNEQQKQQLQASTKLNHKLQQVAYCQPGDRLKEGTQIFILLSVQPKVNDEIVFPPSGSNSTEQLDTVIFMWGFGAASGEEYD